MTNDQKANVAQLVEHIHGKDEVTSSILVIGSEKIIRNLKVGSHFRFQIPGIISFIVINYIL